MSEGAVIQIIDTVAVTVITTAIGLIAKVAVTYLRRGIDQMKVQADHVMDRLQRERFLEALDLLDDVATRTVEMLEQTVAGDLRKLVKEGKADRAGLLQLGEHAWLKVCEILGPEWLEILEQGMSDLDAYIKSLIESKVLNLKKGGQE